MIRGVQSFEGKNGALIDNLGELKYQLYWESQDLANYTINALYRHWCS